MTFSDNYLNHLNVLQNVGMTSIEPIDYEGQQIIPLQFLKAILPDPASLGPRTKGKTNIGCIIQGVKDGKPKRIMFTMFVIMRNVMQRLALKPFLTQLVFLP